jgi:acyl transferase domain-containing protein
MVFNTLQALSRLPALRPFDSEADGTMLAEGVGIVVLKRLADAQRDRDRVYAVVKGVGVSSDGKFSALLAPRMEGEALAIRRAYQAAGVDPATVGLIEAHGTGIPLGDSTEIHALTEVFGIRTGPRPHCAVGSVKSMIGHCISAAGIAGFIKAALALHHKILPATIGCETPNPALRLDRAPFYINLTTRPWIHGKVNTPRRAAVSAMGFGGINAHCVLEEVA